MAHQLKCEVKPLNEMPRTRTGSCVNRAVGMAKTKEEEFGMRVCEYHAKISEANGFYIERYPGVGL